jgi:hypothetical protein
MNLPRRRFLHLAAGAAALSAISRIARALTQQYLGTLSAPARAARHKTIQFPCETPRGSVGSLCVLPDGRLASGSSDNTIRLWDIAARREIARLEIDNGVKCLAALLDGRLVAGDHNGRLHWLEIIT